MTELKMQQFKCYLLWWTIILEQDQKKMRKCSLKLYQSQSRCFRDGSECSQEVAGLTWQPVRTDVDHVEEEGQLAADAVLSVASVVQHLEVKKYQLQLNCQFNQVPNR